MMIKIVCSEDSDHISHIRSAIRDIKCKGYNIYKFEKAYRKKFFGLIGKNVTYIYYNKYGE